MDSVQSLDVLVASESLDGCFFQVSKFVQTVDSHFPMNVKETENHEDTLLQLIDGKGDLAAVSGEWWAQNEDERVQAELFLPRKDPTLVLVSEDKLEYIPKNGVVVANSPLVKRQILRARRDLSVVSSFQAINKEILDVEAITALEDLRIDQEINGYVISRAMHELLPFKTRRHTLGIHKRVEERFKFIPQGLTGFVVLISRKGFQNPSLNRFSDNGAKIAFELEQMALGHIDEKIRPFVGIHAEQRKIGTILKEAEKFQSKQILSSLIQPNQIKLDGKIRIEVMMEIVSYDGRVTGKIERMFKPDDAISSVRNIIIEWNNLLETMTKDQPEEKRRNLPATQRILQIYPPENKT